MINHYQYQLQPQTSNKLSSNTLINSASQQSISQTIAAQFFQKLKCEEISGDISNSTSNKQSYTQICPSQSIDIISNEIEQEVNNREVQLSINEQCQSYKEKNLIVNYTGYRPLQNQKQLKFLETPQIQYTFCLSGDLFIDLRWFMQNTQDDILNSKHIQIYKCPQTYTLKENKLLMIDTDNDSSKLFQFQFLSQMLYTLGTQKAMQMGKLLEQYQNYVNTKKQHLILRKNEITQINMKARKEQSIKQAKNILLKQNPNEFTCSFLGFGDEEDFANQKAQCFSPSMLEILGISSDEITKMTLRKGPASFFDWKTFLNMVFGRLSLISNQNSQRNWSSFEGEIITFDGFRLKASIQVQYYPLNENLLPFYVQNTQKFLIMDNLVIMKFSFHPYLLKQLMMYRSTNVSKEYKQNLLEDELQESVISSIFLEKYYEKELESLGQKRKKIRKTKVKALEEKNYFYKQEKNKYIFFQN